MWLWTYLRSRYPNFHTVVEGRLYRSATPKPHDLERWKKEYGIKTWVDLRMPKDWKGDESFFAAQCATARHQDITRVSLPLDDFGVVSDEQIAVFLEIVANQKNLPLLFGCKGNRHRAGLLCAMYRMRVQGWSKEAALAEAVKCGWYSHGHEVFARRFMELMDQAEKARL